MANGKPKLNAHDGNSAQKQFSTILALVVTGVGIGWLAGLSVSPVISVVITSVIGVAAAIVAALSGVKEEFLDADNSSATLKRFLKAVTPIPLAWLVFGLIVGAGSGVWMRTHNALSPNPPDPPPSLALQEEVAQWEALGLPHEEVVRALFEKQVATKIPAAQGQNTAVNSQESNNASPKDSVLFSVSQDECTEITERAKSDSATNFRRYLSVKPKWQKLTEAIPDDTMLREVVATLCANGG